MSTQDSTPADSSAPLVDPMMMDLFKVELGTQAQALNAGLLEMERQGSTFMGFEALMRAAHSIKGAARIIHMEPLIRLAHGMEDIFVATQNEQVVIGEELINVLLRATDLIIKLSKTTPSIMLAWLNQQKDEWNGICDAIHLLLNKEAPPKKAMTSKSNSSLKQGEPLSPVQHRSDSNRVLRVTAQNLNRLMGLAGEALVESRWLEPFFESLKKVKYAHGRLLEGLEIFKSSLDRNQSLEKKTEVLTEVIGIAEECSNLFSARLNDLDQFIIRNSQLSSRLYGEVINTRMRPFADCVEGFPRMVRDLAKELNKKVRLDVSGRDTPVDRDILDKLESPLGHLLRNAVDHGIESPEVRISSGKPAEGRIVLDAQHRAGMLLITISDDGRGIDLNRLRQNIVERKLINQEIAQKLTENELLEFLFLPGFSTALKITDVSGRGVGLNVVQNMVRELSGSLHVVQEHGKGVAFYLQLPLTLSVIRALIVEISGEPYALPLARIDGVAKIKKNETATVEGCLYFSLEGKNVGLVSAAQVLDLDMQAGGDDDFSVVVFSERSNSYGVIVDRFIDQRELVVHELDPRLKKIPDVYAAALMEDGSPIVLLDVEDMVCSIDRLFLAGEGKYREPALELPPAKEKKRVLVVDDSITVREVEARLLRSHGYEVEIAINGVEGWNAVRLGKFDLVVTDVDMPKMSGIELVRAIRKDPRLKGLPVMMVSYKERESDRSLGLEAGADIYLTKSDFHDEVLLNAIIDLIGR